MMQQRGFWCDSSQIFILLYVHIHDRFFSGFYIFFYKIKLKYEYNEYARACMHACYINKNNNDVSKNVVQLQQGMQIVIQI